MQNKTVLGVGVLEVQELTIDIYDILQHDNMYHSGTLTPIVFECLLGVRPQGDNSALEMYTTALGYAFYPCSYMDQNALDVYYFTVNADQ